MVAALGERRDRFRAAVLGFAIGDALGFPLRGMPPPTSGRLASLTEDFSPRPRGRFAKGQFSDDTQMLLAAADSVALERGVHGRSLGDHFAWLWREGVIVQPPRTVADALRRLAGGTPWMSAGAPVDVKDPASLSRGVTVGLWHSQDPARLAHDAGVLAIVTHKDPTCAAATAAVGRAVALGISDAECSPTAFCAAVSQAARQHDPALADEIQYLPRLLSWELPRALEQLRRIGVKVSTLEGTEGLPAHPTPVLLTALFAALRVPHDFREALALVLQVGGEADVAAGVCGAILGAHLGCEAIPVRLRKNLLYASHVVDTADRLHDARHSPAAAEGVPALASARKA